MRGDITQPFPNFNSCNVDAWEWISIFISQFTGQEVGLHAIWGLDQKLMVEGLSVTSQITKFMGPTWGPAGSCRPQMGPMLAPWVLLSGMACGWPVPSFVWLFILNIEWEILIDLGHSGYAVIQYRIMWTVGISIAFRGHWQSPPQC